jgi:hypothetical protein
VSSKIVPRKAEELMMDNWAIGKFIDWAAGKKGNDKTKEALKEELSEVAADLAGHSESAAELVLARVAAMSWFVLRLHEAQYGDCATSEGGLTIVQSEHQQRRIDRAHRRLMSTLKTLATVRRLAIPALQINVARQQVNQLNVGEPSAASKALERRDGVQQ